MKELDRFETLVSIMDRLRDPDGCPWDREQTFETLRSYLIEECYEVADALDRHDADDLREELGDLLFQIVFLARLAKENGDFTAAQVVRGIAEKMIRRHPHVFADATADTAEQVLRNWEKIKREEKRGESERENEEHPGGASSVLDGIPTALPALLKAQRLGTKAARVGFDWDQAGDVLNKIDEELGELRAAVRRADPTDVREEIGDLLFSVVNLARKMEIDPEGALEATNRKFARRFRWVERRLRDEGHPVDPAHVERMEQLWNACKDDS